MMALRHRNSCRHFDLDMQSDSCHILTWQERLLLPLLKWVAEVLRKMGATDVLDV